MERNAAINVEDGPCPCCGLAVTGAWLYAAGACELCCDPPFRRAPRACGGRHADELRLFLYHAVVGGLMQGWTAVAAAAIDDAHRAGQLVEQGDRWRIVAGAPDPDAWTRITRIVEVDDTIRRVATAAVEGAWSLDGTRQVLTQRLRAISTRALCPGIWQITVEPGYRMNIAPPSSFIDPDTVDTRRRATVDMLVHEAASS